MAKDDETMTVFELLRANGIQLSLATILHCCSSLGWTFRDSGQEAGLVKANSEVNFENVIFTVECSIQMETRRQFACREAPRSKPRP